MKKSYLFLGSIGFKNRIENATKLRDYLPV